MLSKLSLVYLQKSGALGLKWFVTTPDFELYSVPPLLDLTSLRQTLTQVPAGFSTHFLSNQPDWRAALSTLKRISCPPRLAPLPGIYQRCYSESIIALQRSSSLNSCSTALIATPQRSSSLNRSSTVLIVTQHLLHGTHCRSTLIVYS